MKMSISPPPPPPQKKKKKKNREQFFFKSVGREQAGEEVIRGVVEKAGPTGLPAGSDSRTATFAPTLFDYTAVSTPLLLKHLFMAANPCSTA